MPAMRKSFVTTDLLLWLVLAACLLGGVCGCTSWRIHYQRRVVLVLLPPDPNDTPFYYWPPRSAATPRADVRQ